MKKKGSHVGVIMSFVIFITFAVFMYAILQPSITQKGDKQYLLDYLENTIIEMASENLTGITILIYENKNPPLTCVEFEDLITETGINSQIIVKNELEDILSFYNSGEDLEINRNNNDNLFFKIYHSKEFSDSNGESIPSCRNLELDRDYSIGLVKTKKYVFETKIIELINDYENIKGDLENSAGGEFSFSFVYNNNTEVSTPTKNVSTSIYVEKVPVHYIDTQANINSGFINIKTWG